MSIIWMATSRFCDKSLVRTYRGKVCFDFQFSRKQSAEAPTEEANETFRFRFTFRPKICVKSMWI